MVGYQMRTVAGGGLGFCAVGCVGGSAVTVEIRRRGSNASAFYTLYGVDFGFDVGAIFTRGKPGVGAGGHGPSSWTDFEAGCDLGDFEGYVTVLAAGSSVGVGWSYVKLDFITGRAAGVRIAGLGVASGLSIGVNATHGYMRRAA